MGAFLWFLKNSGKSTFLKKNENSILPIQDEEILAEVGDSFVVKDELELEKLLLSKNIDGAFTLPRSGKNSLDLNQTILHSILKRKILYSYVLQDRTFNTKKESRLSECQKEWESSLAYFPEISEQQKSYLKDKICQNSLIKEYCEERVFKKIHPKDDELLAYYEQNRETFKVKESVRLRQVLLSTEKDARRVKAKITPKNFSEMARKYSTAPEAENGGHLPRFTRGELPNVFDKAFGLPTGKVRGIFRSTYGFHLFIVDEKFAEDELSFEASKSKIRHLLMEEKKNRQFEAWVDKAAQSVHTKILRIF